MSDEQLRLEILVRHKNINHTCSIEEVQENSKWSCSNENCTCCDFGIYWTDLPIELTEKKYGWYCPVCLENLGDNLVPPTFPPVPE